MEEKNDSLAEASWQCCLCSLSSTPLSGIPKWLNGQKMLASNPSWILNFFLWIYFFTLTTKNINALRSSLRIVLHLGLYIFCFNARAPVSQLVKAWCSENPSFRSLAASQCSFFSNCNEGLEKRHMYNREDNSVCKYSHLSPPPPFPHTHTHS